MHNRIDVERSRTLLQKKMSTLITSPGSHETALEGLVFYRFDEPEDPKPLIYKPKVIVVVQGNKFVRIGGEDYVYGESSFFITGLDMPAASCVCDIAPGKPFISVSLNLDRALIAQLAAEIPPAPGYASGTSFGNARGVFIQELDAPLLDALLRLAELSENADELRVLGPLIIKEIHYRLLTGPFGPELRSLNTFGSQSNQISRAVSWLMQHYKDPLQVDELARSVNMAPSTFHRHFKEITTLSPLQYQKRLRLTEAQRLMLADSYDATQACHAVGYESVTQFNREYKRLFGDSPRRDVTSRMAG